MSGGKGRKVDKHIDTVHNCIEQCLKLYISKKETARHLLIQKNIKPQITEIVWKRLEEENQEFFKAYYLNLALKEQIMKFNKLLAEQVRVMRRIGLVGVSSMPTMPNGSDILAFQQVHCAPENHVFAMGSNAMHTPVVTNAFTSHGPTMDSDTQLPLGMSFRNRGVDVPFNMFLPQRRSMGRSTGIRPTLNDGGVFDREANYSQSPLGMSFSNRGVDVPFNMLSAQRGSMGIRPTLNDGGVFDREANYTQSPLGMSFCNRGVDVPLNDGGVFDREANYTQSPLGMSFCNRSVGVPFNMLSAQRRGMGIRPTLNSGGVFDREANYTSSSFNHAAPNNFVGLHSSMADASVPSFSSVNSELQPLNESLLDTDASPFGYLGQRPQHVGLQNLISDTAPHTSSSFNYAAPSNFVRSHSAMADASVSSFSRVNSGLQPLNGSLFDTDASSFGYPGQLFQDDVDLQNLISDIATYTDILDDYSDSPFLPSDSKQYP